MSLPKLTFSDIFLIIINLVPLYGVWFEGWDPLKVFIVYCLETVIIGVMNVFKMLIASFFYKAPATTDNKGCMAGAPLFIIVFFIFHYGFFVFVQTQIFMGVVNIGNNSGLFGKYRDMFSILGPEGQLLLLIFAAYYALDMIMNFILPGKFRDASLPLLMFQPYGRIFIQQVIVILGSFFLMFDLPKLFVLIFVLIKLTADLTVSRYISGKLNDAVLNPVDAKEF